MLVEQRRVDSLRPYDRNPRVNDHAVAQVAESIRQFGFRQPIVVDDQGVIVAGHTRWKAAQLLGLELVPVHVAAGMTPDQVRAYRVADNKLADLAEWNQDLLSIELAELRDAGVDPALLGFSPEEVERLLGAASLEVDDADAPIELPANPVSKPGDLYQLGRHRLLCGDSTDARSIARLFAGARPKLMVTDPPYGVEYEAAWRHGAGLSSSGQVGKVQNDHRASWAAAFRHFPGAVAYVWHAATFSLDVERSLRAVGLELRAQIIWVKPRFAISRGHYHWRHEACWYAVRPGASAEWAGGRKQQTVWADIVDSFRGPSDLFAARVDDSTVLAFDASSTTVWEIGHDRAAGGGHSTQKPVECMARPIRNHGDAGDDVFEPFMGSGTTLIACEQLDRRCFGMEIDPRYVDAIVSRFEKFTGTKAERVTA